MTNPNETIHPLYQGDPLYTQDKIGWAGLSKREYFAALALQGLCASGKFFTKEPYAKVAVEYADALIEELNK